MKRLSLFAVALLVAAPLAAADRSFELTGWASWVDTNSTNTFNSTSSNQPFNLNFHGKLGYGAGANIFFGHNISTEFSVVQVRPKTTFVSTSGGTLVGGNLRMTPITAIMQFHFAPSGFIDPYIGAGAAYVLFDNVNGPGSIGVSNINFKDDVGLALNAGVGFVIAGNLAITADGKYVPLKSSATAVYVTGPNTTQRIKINPVMFSAGLTFRF
jgi:outer membrane protein W